MDNFRKYILNEIKSSLREQFSNQEDFLNSLYKQINSLKDLGIVSVTSSNKSDFGIVVRFEDNESLRKGVKTLKAAIKSPDVTLTSEHIPKFYSAEDVTRVERKDGTAMAYIIYKADLAIRDGLALEQIVKYVLSGEVDEQLKNRIDLSPNASNSDVKNKLKTDYRDVYKIALIGKKKILNAIGEISKAESVGSQSSKADLVLYTPENKKYGLSIKLVEEEGRDVRFTYNKNLGYGDEEDDNLVGNPTGKPWWMVGRQIFAKKLGRSYKPKSDDIECPSWMTKAKEDKPDVYREAMEEVYAKVREVLTTNLKRLRLKELVDLVREAQLGVEKERNNYDGFMKLTSTSEGVKLVLQKEAKPDIEKIRSGISKNDIIKTQGAKIIISIPGMEELVIHGVKFHSNMLSDDKQNLKIKTR
jgi:hypothetical protein